MMIEQSCAAPTQIFLRPPALSDAAAIDVVVRGSGQLDPNSRYAYLLLCRHFASTCAVAECDGRLVGFLSAYRLPDNPRTLFVWQIAVDDAHRGRGVARGLLDEVLGREACAAVRYVEATVAPGNEPSRALFRSLARRMGAAWQESAGFPASAFHPESHEPEPLIRIGPIDPSQLNRRRA